MLTLRLRAGLFAACVPGVICTVNISFEKNGFTLDYKFIMHISVLTFIEAKRYVYVGLHVRICNQNILFVTY